MIQSVSGIEIAEQWKKDTCISVQMYNDWFMQFAPKTYIDEKIKAEESIDVALKKTCNFLKLDHGILMADPKTIFLMRMATTPPLASDRLAGLADVPGSLLDSLEKGELPKRMKKDILSCHLKSIVEIISRLLDKQLMPWIDCNIPPTSSELQIAKMVLADRLCASNANPLIRNEQEHRQLKCISSYLEGKGYYYTKTVKHFRTMNPGTFSFHVDVPVKKGRGTFHMPIDVVIMPKNAKPGNLPMLIECKSAGDYANVNKRRKEESEKMNRLITTYGTGIKDNKLFKLFLCGYFNNNYLSFEAESGIDWIWEHRVDDFARAGI